MRLLQRNDNGDFSHTREFRGNNDIPPYAILSHTWKQDQEVTFQDLIDGTGQSKIGYDKIRFCGQQAEQDGLQYFWVDTCCIDKSDELELSHSINSMFRWYRDATKCYAYLSDVSRSSNAVDSHQWEPQFRKSKWFTRGWTLQELLAPRSVEFFSLEWKTLGDKESLKQILHELTKVPYEALEGVPLSQFSDSERFLWMEPRHTKLPEDKAYALLGIMGIQLHTMYGEGAERAFSRLQKELDKLNKCLHDLRPANPHDDKRRIEETKGGLLQAPYLSILKNSSFQGWFASQQSLLWISGGPGKGKTMLLCGMVNELNRHRTVLPCYFFCQANDSRINNAISVLRGLLYSLLWQRPSLAKHIQKRYDHAGIALFKDTNAWVALSEIFTSVLHDPSLDSAYMIIDALDECVAELPRLLDFIVTRSCINPRVRWIISSRKTHSIEERLERVDAKEWSSLELGKENLSEAVGLYLQERVSRLAKRQKYDDSTRDAVKLHLSQNADDSFLWVDLACQILEETPQEETLRKLTTLFPGSESFKKPMTRWRPTSEDAPLHKPHEATKGKRSFFVPWYCLTSLIHIRLVARTILQTSLVRG